MNKDSKIFVAGHRGLVGSALVRMLHQQGYSNIICKTRDELNLLDAQAVSNFFSTEKPEFVFLAAAKVGGIMANNTYRADFLFENLTIQNNVIHHAYANGVKKLLFLGSTCIYPKHAPQPMPEDSLLTDTLEYTNEPYAIAKIAGIKLCESYNIQYGTNFISVMPTNLYGTGDNFDLEKSHVLPALIRKIHLAKYYLEGNKDAIIQNLHVDSWQNAMSILHRFGISQNQVEIWGSGKPLREFMWSEDMAKACIHIMERVNFSDLQQGTEIRNTHINIGTGREISIAELASLIARVVGYTGSFVFNTSKPDGTLRKLTDVSKLHQLGYRHEVELEEGIQRVYAWYKENQA